MKAIQTQCEVPKTAKGKPEITPPAKNHPKKAIVTALRKFMAAREGKIEKQLHDGKRRTDVNHLALFEKARQLALRLADPQQVLAYIGELNQEAVDHAHRHHLKLTECQSFWYGPNGLKWLANKKGMEPKEWSAYAEFMDAAALKALQQISLEAESRQRLEEDVVRISRRAVA
jgi:hypothetical protein